MNRESILLPAFKIYHYVEAIYSPLKFGVIIQNMRNIFQNFYFYMTFFLFNWIFDCQTALQWYLERNNITVGKMLAVRISNHEFSLCCIQRWLAFILFLILLLNASIRSKYIKFKLKRQNSVTIFGSNLFIFLF